MRLYASCPVCAHKLMKGENGTQADIKNLVRIRIADDIVTVNLIETISTTTENKGRHCPV